MPPKVQVTQDAILNAAICIIKDKGIGGLNARDIAKSLGCSVQPIFRNFQSMENLKESLYKQAEEMFDQHMRNGLTLHPIPFLGMGLAYIRFAKNEKNLFKFLFMSDGFKGRSVQDMIHGDENHEIVRIISGMTGLPFEKSERLFISIWLTTHGIAAMMATNDCDFSEELIAAILMDSFSGMKILLKEQENAE